LNKKLKELKFDVIVTAEAKSIPLAYALSVESKKPYVILRKSYKPYMGAALIAETLSITTGEPQTLIMDEKDQSDVKGKRAVIVDDVISTGSTLQGMRMIMEKAGAEIVGEAGITDLDWLYLAFGDEFERKFLNQGYDENRTIDDTLNVGWETLSILPKSELISIRERDIERHYVEGKSAETLGRRASKGSA
jgi:orotate phosphoribosyltransferase